MKYMGDMLLTKRAFSEIVMGNTALVRGMVEAGTRVVSAYPGSPTPEIGAAIKSIPANERPFYFEFSTNEKVATELALGASVNGHLSTVFFKSVGLNVASDTFVQLSMLNLIGGMVIVLGDDPGVNSSQNEQDNRHYSYMSYTPMLEPSDPGEVYLFYKEAARLSKELQYPVILRLSTHICHAKEKVSFQAWEPKEHDDTPRFKRENGPYVPISAPMVFPLKRKTFEKLEAVTQWAETSELNRLIDNQNKEYGIITSGLPFLSLMDALEQTEKKPNILKLATAYPLPRNLTADFLRSHKRVKVLEELDNEMEKEIKSLAYDLDLSVKISGKIDMEDWIGEYTSDKVYEVIAKTWPDMLPPKKSVKEEPYVGGRPPQMCPGCGHRSAFHAVKKAMKDTDISVGDIGCHTLGFYPPYYMGEILLCMGASPGIGSGLSLFNPDRKVIVFMGDSTFFHAGLPGTINALFNKHNITMVLMENGTTAMTGHQEHPATGNNFNDVTDKIPIRQVFEQGLGVKNIHEVDAYNQKKLIEMVKAATNEEGFSLIIAKHPCMLKFMREQGRKPGRKKRQVSVNQDACERINECVEVFACPSFSRSENGEIAVNSELCIGDGSCVQTCPISAIHYPKAND